MKTFLTLTIVQLASLFCFGFVLPLDVVLKKNTELSGSHIIAVEQDVIFKDPVQDLVIHESWLIEGDKNLKLTATGMGDLKDSFHYVALYNNKNKTWLSGKNKLTEAASLEFFERFLSVRSLASYKNLMSDLGLHHVVRLSRAGGAISFAVGELSPVGTPRPQIWIGQDTFQLKKMRTVGAAEISFDDYGIFGSSLQYPKSKKVEWSGKTVLIKVRSINPKANATLSSFYPQNLDQSTDVLVSNRSATGLMIEEFYKRFR
ncbi:MAG: hypothetical protein H7061_05290 [Bdellovibrionaceae bacterium]|nr:hypothetical protein [Bdellovibrio sp.]